MSDLGWTNYDTMEEEINTNACARAAIADGHTYKEAETCDDGDLKCKLCPWRKTE